MVDLPSAPAMLGLAKGGGRAADAAWQAGWDEACERVRRLGWWAFDDVDTYPWDDQVAWRVVRQLWGGGGSGIATAGFCGRLEASTGTDRAQFRDAYRAVAARSHANTALTAMKHPSVHPSVGKVLSIAKVPE